MSSIVGTIMKVFIAVFLTVVVSEEVPRIKSSYGTTSEAIAYPDELMVHGVHDKYHHHHHHEHPPGYHFHSHEHGYGEEGVVEMESPRNEGRRDNSSMKIPLNFIQSFNDYNVSDLLLNFVEGVEEEAKPLFANRFGETEEDERSAGDIPKPATCMPELTTIKLASSNDPSVFYIPQCTRVERCGGCCSHTLLSCQPVQTETLTYKVMKTQYTGGKKLKYLGKEVMAIEKHTKCKCDCKIKAEDCNQYQEYRKGECRCACKNIDEEKKCNKNNYTKLWDPQLCACRCRDIQQCSTGYTFDQNDCKCVAVSMKRRYASYDRKGYKSGALPVIPLYEDEEN